MLRKLNPDFTHFGGLLSLKAQASDDETTRVVHEHLREACQYLAGGRFLEYVHELEFARRAAGGMADRSLRKTVAREIAGLIEVAQAA